MGADYIIADGKITTPEQVAETTEILINSYFSLTEQIWFCNGNLPLFGEHLGLLNEKISLLRLPLPVFLNNPDELLRLIRRLINKRKAFFSGIIRMKIIWDETGGHYFISCRPSTENHFKMQGEGLLMAFADENKFSGSKLARFYFSNENLWQFISSAGSKNKNAGFIILNEKGEVCESPGANLFLINGTSVLTPSPETGCYIDPVRRKILESAVECGFTVLETSKITPETLPSMEEAFLGSEVSGICKITGVGQKRFIHSKTQLIYQRLIQILGKTN